MSRKELALKLLLQMREAHLSYWARTSDGACAFEAGLISNRDVKEAHEQAGYIFAALAKLETAP